MQLHYVVDHPKVGEWLISKKLRIQGKTPLRPNPIRQNPTQTQPHSLILISGQNPTFKIILKI